MKILKWLGIVLGAIIVLVLILMFVAPTEYVVSRSIVINAPQSVAMDFAVKFQNYTKWNPWDEDPNMKNSFEGIDGTVGSKYAWDGNDQVGAGTMEIVSITDNRVDIKLHFIKPFEGDAETWFTFEKADSGINLTWGMNGHAMRPMNILSLFNVMENMIGSKYETGLKSLKNLTEAYAANHTKRGYFIHETELSERTYYGVKGVVKMADIQKFYDKNFNAVLTAGTKTGLQPTTPPSGLYFVWDERNMKAELFAGMAFSSPIKGFDSVRVSGKILHVAYYGPGEKSGEAHYALDDFMKANNLTQLSPVVEEYVTDPKTEKDPAKLLTNIYYPVK